MSAFDVAYTVALTLACAVTVARILQWALPPLRRPSVERLADPAPLPGERCQPRMTDDEARERVADYDLSLWDAELHQMPGTGMPLRQPWDGAE